MSKRRATSRGLSRRRFLQLGACGAGSALLVHSALGKPLSAALARLCPNPESSYLPLLSIAHGSPSAAISPFNSPAIQLSLSPDGSGPVGTAGHFYPVVTVENQGTAPVFNAMVNFYSFAFGLEPFPAPPADVGRADAGFLATRLVSIPPRSSRVVVSPATMFFPGVGLGVFFPYVPVVVVECFDPLADPIRNPGSLFHVGSDRHAAARSF